MLMRPMTPCRELYETLEFVGDKCSINNEDRATCFATFMRRRDGTYSLCLYDDSEEGGRYKPNDDPPYDARCYSSPTKLECSSPPPARPPRPPRRRSKSCAPPKPIGVVLGLC